MSFFLPPDYNSRIENQHFLDKPTENVYQPHVYELAAFLARRSGVRRIIDVGCGSGAKLSGLTNEFEIIGIDCAATIPLFRENNKNAKWIICDLESELPEISKDYLTDSLVICSDVIEHLQNPEPLARYLADISLIAPYVLISTPDRDRVRGWLDDGPPANPCHVREWGASEFLRFLRSSGFPEHVLFGHTINTYSHRVNSTLLVIAGSHSYPSIEFQRRKVAAVIHSFNEIDILPEVVNHLVRQGVDVYLFDNWSTDGTWELALELHSAGLLRRLERFPDEAKNEYDWAQLLKHTEEISQDIDADWVIHYDADELRYSPWPGVTLVDGISWACSLGYNAIDFTVIDFRFIAGRPDIAGNYEASLSHFEFGRRSGHFLQIKAWRNRQKVQLVDSGGHEALFENRRVFPLKFLTKHYPLRNSVQARRKIFEERLPRVQREQAERGWHTHYHPFERIGDVPGWRYHELLPWAESYFLTEYVVQRLSGIGVRD